MKTTETEISMDEIKTRINYHQQLAKMIMEDNLDDLDVYDYDYEYNEHNDDDM